MQDDIEGPRFLVAELPDEIGAQVYSMFIAGWPIHARMRAVKGCTTIDIRARSPINGVYDALVTVLYDGMWRVREDFTGLVSPGNVVFAQDSESVVEHLFRHVPGWLVPEVGPHPHAEFVDLYEGLQDEKDPLLDGLARRLESVANAMFCALTAGWDATMTIETCGDGATILMSTQIPTDLDENLRWRIGEALELDIQDMRMQWRLRDNGWCLDVEQTGFVGTDETIDVATLDTLCDVMVGAASNGAFPTSDSSKQWHSAGASTPSSVLPAVPLALEPPPRPDVVAARLHRTAMWSSENGFSAPLEPNPTTVARKLDEAGAGCAGYYILEFVDGQCYIGESIDLPERLRQHRARYQDIQQVRIRPDSAATGSLLGKRHLRLHEKSLIHSAQAAGLLARNINEMATMLGVSKYLDELVSPEEQRLWLDAPDIVNTTDTAMRQSFSSERLVRTAVNYQQFRHRDDGDQITRIIGHYLNRCVPYPVRTEHHCWALSCLTSPGKSFGRLSCLTIAMTEALVIYQDRGMPPGGKIQVNEAELFPSDASEFMFLRRHPAVRVTEVGYQESGPGQLFLHADTLDDLERLLDDVIVTRAAATTALHIMRRGPCMQRKVHCPQLADAAFTAASARYRAM